MAIKRVELMNANNGLGCLGKAADEEPVFILRAKDKHAPMAIRLWAHLAQMSGCSSQKVSEAMNLASAMEQWPDRKYPD